MVNQARSLPRSYVTARAELHESELFSGIDSEVLFLLASGSTVKTLPAGTVLMRSSEAPRHIIHLIQGTVVRYQRDHGGTRSIDLSRMSAPEVIGDWGLFGRSKDPAAARCESEVRAIFIEKNAFAEAIRTSHQLALRLYQMASIRSLRALERVASTGICDPSTRISLLLLDRASRMSEGESVPDEVRLRKSDIARALGLSRQTVNRAVDDLSRRGLVSFRRTGAFVIHDRLRLSRAVPRWALDPNGHGCSFSCIGVDSNSGS